MKIHYLAVTFGFVFIILFSTAGYSQDGKSGESKEMRIYKPEKGFLKVYTAIEKKYDDGITKNIFKPYKIFDESGNLLIIVGSSLEEPAAVKLLHGNYLIAAEMRKGIPETFKVLIESGKITEVEAQ